MYQEGAWRNSGAPRGDDYDAQIAARLRGKNPHGEADFVDDLLRRALDERREAIVLCDGGCGTGRVAIELAHRGYSTLGVDNDAEMLSVARRKAPELRWILGDLASVELDIRPDVVVLAGNVMIFVDQGQEEAVVHNLARQLRLGGFLIAGFQLGSGRIELHEYERLAAAAGLHFVERWATWDGQPWDSSSNYAVSVHQRGS